VSLLRPVPGWPARLSVGATPTSPRMVLRPLQASDAAAWREVRQRNAAWLLPWDATVPPGADQRPMTFGSLVRRLRRSAAKGTTLPFAIEVDGRFVGQLTVNNVVRGSAQFASVGYWIDREVAGHGLVPRAVAMVVDHCFTTVGLHRIEVAIRPENTNSLRVVEKLDLHEVGYAPRFLHIDGEWRDHRIFAITAEECPQGLVRRLADAERPEAPDQAGSAGPIGDTRHDLPGGSRPGS